MSLFSPDTPGGFEYREDFISAAEEAALLEDIARVAFSNFEMRGVVARRRVAFFGASYDQGDVPSPPIPEFLRPLMARAAEWAAVAPDAFAMALINEYRAGSPIGWHRDAPQYDIVAGISLQSPARMRFRPYVSPADNVRLPPSRAQRASASLAEAFGVGGKPDTTSAFGRRKASHEITLRPRSAYLMTGESRNAYEHSIPPVAALRYSVTFRTLRAGRSLRLPRPGG
jgi:alkylated DNA repair dioxygenase AlkB